MHPFGVAKSSTSFGWGKGWNVTSAGWQVTLCDPIRHVSSSSGEACCELLYPVTLLYFTIDNNHKTCRTWAAGKDDVFGENVCVYQTIGKSTCNVRALTYCDLHKIHRDDLLDLLEMYPDFASHFSTNLQVTFELRDVSRLSSSHLNGGGSTLKWNCFKEF